jgi:hypothetical protein
MRRAREAVEDARIRDRPKTATRQSDAQLRRLFKQAAQASDAGRKARLKEGFIWEFYEGAR